MIGTETATKPHLKTALASLEMPAAVPASPAMRCPTLPQQKPPSLPLLTAPPPWRGENNKQKDASGGVFPSPLQIWMETKK